MERNFNFKIPSELDSELKAEAQRTGAPMSEIVRRAIKIYLSKKKNDSEEYYTAKEVLAG